MPKNPIIKFISCCLFLFIFFQLPAGEFYNLKFKGISKEQISFLESISQLASLEKDKPKTKASLKRRAESDVEGFIKALQSLGYYGAKVEFNINFDTNPPLVLFQIKTGPLYPLKEFNILPDPQYKHFFRLPECIDLENLGIELNQTALPKDIIQGQERLLEILEKLGYPLAKVSKRDVLVDETKKNVVVNIYLNQGPLCYFGPVTILGQESVFDELFYKKITWCEGDIYDPKLIDKTQSKLEGTNLFSSINITHPEEARDGVLPITIQVIERKHRSVAAGVAYSTETGAGVLAEWEHRNISNIGERISFKVNIAQIVQEGRFVYVRPDFGRIGQDFLWIVDSQREITKGFRTFSVSLSGIFERQINDHLRISYGGSFKRITDSHTDNDRVFTLLKSPFQLRWNKTNNLLDPTKGHTISLKVIPSVQIIKPQFIYCINLLTGTYYKAINHNDKYIFATKGVFGTIFGSSRHSIPPSERFYAGSENLLRGYHYLTVSPLNHDDRRPVGGRSMLIFSTELRIRNRNSLGYVLFYDFGNVYRTWLPEIGHKFLQSIGGGLRYDTPVGPLRFDLAFPLNRRKHIDGPFQFYVSIGQAF
ncbi:MAG: hypothetical protein BGO10_10835 [Chlamydia sp. 32-24]|nr:MAG: hypothetical protein BGO10_10835 [Chlamydia sp. 32-24]